MAGDDPPQSARDGPAAHADKRRSSRALRNENNLSEDPDAWHAPLSVNASSSVLDSLAESVSVTKDDRDTLPAQTGPKSRLTFSHPSSSESLYESGQPSPPRAAALAPAPARHSLKPEPPQPVSPTSPRPNPRQASFWLRRRVLCVIAVAIMLALLVILVVALTFHAAAVCPVVGVQAGKYAGVELGNGVTQWMGIRYAAPPIGENRFSAPKDPEPFVGVVSANKVRTDLGSPFKRALAYT